MSTNEEEDAPVTRRYFNEVIEKFANAINVRFDSVEERLGRVEGRLDNVEGRLDKVEGQLRKLKGQMSESISFQAHESFAIEYELEAVLKKHLAKKYPLRVITDFPVKKLYHHLTDKLITDLDAAFLVKPYIRRTNTRRLRNAGIAPPLGRNNAPDNDYYFILAEAKHHVNKNKIAQKLWQFEQIRHRFRLAKRIEDGTADPRESSEQFKRTVQREKYMSKISESRLYFGSPYWDRGLASELSNALQEWNSLADEFQSVSTDEEKIAIFKKIVELETNWYSDTNHPLRTTPKSIVTDADIMALTEIDGAMKYVELIVPSGGRYMIVESHSEGPEGILARTNGGGLKEVRT